MKIMGLEVNFRRFPPFNRRKAERVRVDEKVYLDYHNPAANENGSAQGKDLSALGICFASPTLFPINSRLDLNLRFTPYYGITKSVRTRVRIVRCSRESYQRHYRIGASFDQLDTIAQREIRSFVRWLKEQIW